MITLILNNTVKAENPCGIMIPKDTTNWGEGVIWLKKNSKVNIRNENQRLIGTIYRTPENGHFEITSGDNKLSLLKNTDLVSVGHVSLAFIKVYEIQDNMCLIFKQSFGNEIWVDISDLEKMQGEYFNYEQLLFDNKSTFPEEIKQLIEQSKIGVNLIGICLNLRKKPNTDSEKIMCIDSYNVKTSSHTHFRIMDYSNGWSLVESTYFVSTPDIDDYGEGCAFKEERRETGWVKAISDNGHPNIWYSVTAY